MSVDENKHNVSNKYILSGDTHSILAFYGSLLVLCSEVFLAICISCWVHLHFFLCLASYIYSAISLHIRILDSAWLLFTMMHCLSNNQMSALLWNRLDSNLCTHTWPFARLIQESRVVLSKHISQAIIFAENSCLPWRLIFVFFP